MRLVEIRMLWNFRCVPLVCCGMYYFLMFPRRSWHFLWQTSCSAWQMRMLQSPVVFGGWTDNFSDKSFTLLTLYCLVFAPKCCLGLCISST